MWMGIVFAKLQHKYFELNKIQNFSVKISNNIVSLVQKNYFVEVTITGRKHNEKLISFVFDILSMMFLYLGSFPNIKELTVGEQVVDILPLSIFPIHILRGKTLIYVKSQNRQYVKKHIIGLNHYRVCLSIRCNIWHQNVTSI